MDDDNIVDINKIECTTQFGMEISFVKPKHRLANLYKKKKKID